VADWDANSPALARNLQELGRSITTAAAARQPVSSAVIREWQALIMRGLVAAAGEPFGAYRGEAGLEDYNVEVAGHFGTLAERVGAELVEFDRTLAERLDELDRTIRDEHFDEDLTADNVVAVIILCAWAHGEWVRIHPFPNGNGRTARVLVNSIAQRYGLPAFMRVRPRPGPEYAVVATQSMAGNWRAAVPLFMKLLYEAAT
jgi:Fic family protein